MILAVKAADSFVTQPLWVEVSGDRLNYFALPEPLSFSQMQALRRPITLPSSQAFQCKLANLGVSAKITLELDGQCFDILVHTPSRANILKLISGYVPSEHIANPQAMVLQEISEECLIQIAQGFLGCRLEQIPIARAYPKTLAYCDQDFTLKAIGSTQNVLHQGQALPAQPSAYIHTPTASLQLVYAFKLTLPAQCQVLGLEHVDERFDQGQLIVERSEASMLCLRSISNPKRLYQYKNGQLVPVSDHHFKLSEAFASAQHWQIHQDSLEP